MLRAPSQEPPRASSLGWRVLVLVGGPRFCLIQLFIQLDARGAAVMRELQPSHVAFAAGRVLLGVSASTLRWD